MSDDRDIEAVAEVIARSRHANGIGPVQAARAVLDSDWLAKRIAQARADGWDEGYDATWSPETPNPYRAKATP